MSSPHLSPIFRALTVIFLTINSLCADLSSALSPLYKADLESAKIAIKQLEQIAGTKADNFQEAAEIASVIKNLYRAEFNLSKAIDLKSEAEKEALKEDKKALDWLEGTILNPKGNPTHSRTARVKAANLRQTASDRVAKDQRTLIESMKAVDEKIKVLFKSDETESAFILYGCIKSLNKQYLSYKPFVPTVSEDELETLESFLSNKPLFISKAKAAEDAGAYEKALGLYSKAKDQTGIGRAAGFLAEELEENKLYAEAAEKYEIAGKYAEAKRIRDAHPEFIRESFTKLNSRQLFEKMRSVVVYVKTGKGHGTGFFFNRGGYILTNQHVVGDSKYVKVITANQEEHEGRVLAVQEAPDLAIVKIELREHSIARLGFNLDLKTGSPVSAIGFPTYSDSSSPTITSGIVSNNQRKITDGKFPGTYVQTDAAINGGNSGGPLCLQTGQVAGVVVMKQIIKGGEIIQNTNFAVPMDQVAKFLDEHKNQIDNYRSESPQNIPSNFDVEKMTSAVVSVSSSRGNGSGFFYRKGGYVLTCKHLLGSSREVKVITTEKREYTGKVLAKSLASNLAVIKIDLQDHAVIDLGTEKDVSANSTVSVIGFPKAGASSASAIRSGSIINKSREIITQFYIQINALLGKRSSGAPLCGPTGKAIGIVTVPPPKYSGDEQLNIAIKISDISKFLGKYSSRINR